MDGDRGWDVCLVDRGLDEADFLHVPVAVGPILALGTLPTLSRPLEADTRERKVMPDRAHALRGRTENVLVISLVLSLSYQFYYCLSSSRRHLFLGRCRSAAHSFRHGRHRPDLAQLPPPLPEP